MAAYNQLNNMNGVNLTDIVSVSEVKAKPAPKPKPVSFFD